MSTRCNIHFGDRRDGVFVTEANVYRHSDGYPDSQHGVPASLERFFAAVKEQTSDTRFNDPSYLAAKFVVWQAGEYASNGKPLDFLSVGIMARDAGDAAYIYEVDSNKLDANGNPTVIYREA